MSATDCALPCRVASPLGQAALPSRSSCDVTESPVFRSWTAQTIRHQTGRPHELMHLGVSKPVSTAERFHSHGAGRPRLRSAFLHHR